MSSCKETSPVSLGSLSLSLSKGGGRYCLWFSKDLAIYFINVDKLFTRWKEQKLGETVIFSTVQETYDIPVKIERKSSGVRVPIPEGFRRQMGLSNGNRVKIRLNQLDDSGNLQFVMEGGI